MELIPSDNITPKKKLRSFVDETLAISESVTGAMLGYLLPGPVGAVAGLIAAGFLVRRFQPIFHSIIDEKLSTREKVRTVAALYFAEELVQDQLNSGALPRAEFTRGESNLSSQANMLVEETLRIAQREYEDKKIRYISALISSYIFHEDIKQNTLVNILELSRHIRYSQMVVLSIFLSKAGDNSLRESALDTNTATPEELVLAAQIHDLSDKKLLDLSSDSQPLFGNRIVIPRTITTTKLGKIASDLLNLRSIEKDDPNEYINILNLLA